MKVKIEDQYTIIIKDQRIKLNRDELNELRDELDRVLGQKQQYFCPHWWTGTYDPNVHATFTQPEPFRHGVWIGDPPEGWFPSTWGTNGPTSSAQVEYDSAKHKIGHPDCPDPLDGMPNFHCKPDHNPDNDGTSVR